MQVLQYKRHNSDLIAKGLWTVGAGQKPGNRRETVVRCADRRILSRASVAFPLLWYRYQVATWYLGLEDWSEREVFTTALGIEGDEEHTLDKGFASIAQAIVDVSLVDATMQLRGQELMPRRHQDFRVSAIGIIERLTWELGERTEKGRDTDAQIQEMFAPGQLCAI